MSDPIYFGTKAVLAIPMNRLAYNSYRGWDLPADEDGNDPGYVRGLAGFPDGHAGA